MEQEILLFGGTTEGRQLADALLKAGVATQVCVATEYGKQLLPQDKGLAVSAQRLNQEEISNLLRERKYCCVIDATHPYATEVTKNIYTASAENAVPYYRLERENSQKLLGIHAVESMAEAVEYLSEVEGNILLTTGSKELEPFLQIPNWEKRIYLRVLPTVEAIEKCLSLGFLGKNILAMQGPFSEEINMAMLKQYDIRYLVTKESGRAGGFYEKIVAAEKVGAEAIVIGRPKEDFQPQNRYSFQELTELLGQKYQIKLGESEKAVPEFFPIFMSLKGKKVQVFGGGEVALRRVQSLIDYECSIELKAPKIHPDLYELEKRYPERLKCIQGEYISGECAGDFILASTDDSDVNGKIAQEARAKGILVNRSDRREECDFYFPALIQKDGVTIGICASGKNHRLVKETAAELRAYLGREKKGTI